jgi:broad specificity phosphatase PhoE
MNHLIFVRHGATDEMDRMLCGRRPGIQLNQEGVRQAKQAAQSLAGINISRIISSPLERAVETAQILASGAALPVVQSEAFQECDFGQWAGLSFPELDELAEWRRFNSLRSLVAAPSGESLFDVQYRAVGGMRRLIEENPNSDQIIVTHADVIRAVVCFFSGTPLDLHLRYTIRPASLSVLGVSEYSVRIEGVNIASFEK